jgi:hypothetical protein
MRTVTPDKSQLVRRMASSVNRGRYLRDLLTPLLCGKLEITLRLVDCVTFSLNKYVANKSKTENRAGLEQW